MGLTAIPQAETFSKQLSSSALQKSFDPTKNHQNQLNSKECAGCGKIIIERYLLKALDIFWHEDCLKCGCCDCRLGEVGSTLYIKANLILCKRDYLRLFGNTGSCAACNKVIPAFEMVMKAKCNVYHLECFACFTCQHRFCVGDKYYLCDNKILCPYDYEERLVFAGFADNPNVSLSYMKRQLNNLQPVSENRNSNNNIMNQNASRFGLFSNSSSSDNNNVMCLRIKPDKDDASSGYDSPDPEPNESEIFERNSALL